MSKSRKLRAGIVVLGLLASVLVMQVGFPGVAQARCAGVDHPIVSTLLTYVEEKPATGSCNNNNTYTGLFRAMQSYPSIPVVLIQNNGQWTPYLGHSDGSWDTYSYTDNNSHSEMVLCVVSDDFYSVWYCGWGGNYTVLRDSSLQTILYTAEARYFSSGINFGF